MPNLSEALAEAVRDHLATVAEAERQREASQRVDRAGTLTKVLGRLTYALRADPAHLSIPPEGTEVLEITTNERLDRRHYLAVTISDITVAVELWPHVGAEHELERGFFVNRCSLCDQQIAVKIHLYRPDDIAASYLVGQHVRSLGCDEPF